MFETLNPLLDVVNPEESILNASVPFVLAAIVPAAGKKMPVLVSPVGTMAGAAAVPVPVVTSVVATRVGMVPVVQAAAVVALHLATAALAATAMAV